ncbi:MAG: hypothetical protein ABSH13_15705 [Candidatus Acidiferrum sp.]|jgi:hypothetical protein
MIIRLVLYSSVYFNHYFYLLVAPNVARLGHARRDIAAPRFDYEKNSQGMIGVPANRSWRVRMIDDGKTTCPLIHGPSRTLLRSVDEHTGGR